MHLHRLDSKTKFCVDSVSRKPDLILKVFDKLSKRALMGQDWCAWRVLGLDTALIVVPTAISPYENSVTVA